MTIGATRGERNNNAGNIRISDIPWKGKIKGTDTAFETFDKPENGVRAIVKILINYQVKHGLRTIQQIICRWAPPNENKTGAYINAVCADCNVLSTISVDLKSDPVLMTNLVKAIIKHENGRVIYGDQLINQWVKAAIK